METKQIKREAAGVGEKIQYCVHELNDNTVRFAIKYPCLLSAEIMRQATLMVVKSVDILQASFIYDSGEVFWQINEEITGQDCFVYLVEKEDPECAMKRALVKSIETDAKAQMFCTLIHSERESILVLNISHLCVDGSDGKYLLLKLIRAYQLLAKKEDIKGFEVKSGSRSVFQVYEKCTRKEYLSAMLPKLSRIKSEFPFEKSEKGKPQIRIKTISAETMKNARKMGRERQASVNDLLLSACYKAYAGLEEIDAAAAMSILAMMDLRSHCKDGKSEGLCNLSGPMSTELKRGAESEFDKILEEVCRQTQKEKNNPIAGLHGMPLLHTVTGKLPFWLLLKIAKKVYGNFTIGMTNLGNLEKAELILEGSEPVDCIFAGPLKKKPGMQIAAVGMDGNVTLCCIGEYSEKDAQKISRMLDDIERILRECNNY